LAVEEAASRRKQQQGSQQEQQRATVARLSMDTFIRVCFDFLVFNFIQMNFIRFQIFYKIKKISRQNMLACQRRRTNFRLKMPA
jgi:hypothetical protein